MNRVFVNQDEVHGDMTGERLLEIIQRVGETCPPGLGVGRGGGGRVRGRLGGGGGGVVAGSVRGFWVPAVWDTSHKEGWARGRGGGGGLFEDKKTKRSLPQTKQKKRGGGEEISPSPNQMVCLQVVIPIPDGHLVPTQNHFLMLTEGKVTGHSAITPHTHSDSQSKTGQIQTPGGGGDLVPSMP